MFNLILLLIIGFVQFLPSMVVDVLEGDKQWELWHISMLVIICLQALYIYKGITFKNLYIKGISFILFVASAWYLFDYLAITAVYEEVVEDMIFNVGL